MSENANDAGRDFGAILDETACLISGSPRPMTMCAVYNILQEAFRPLCDANYGRASANDAGVDLDAIEATIFCNVRDAVLKIQCHSVSGKDYSFDTRQAQRFVDEAVRCTVVRQKQAIDAANAALVAKVERLTKNAEVLCDKLNEQFDEKAALVGARDAQTEMINQLMGQIGNCSHENAALVDRNADLVRECIMRKDENAALGKWRDAVIDGLVINHILTAEHEKDPRKALADLIAWEQKIALDPQVSSAASELIANAHSALVDKHTVALRHELGRINRLTEEKVALVSDAKKCERDVEAWITEYNKIATQNAALVAQLAEAGVEIEQMESGRDHYKQIWIRAKDEKAALVAENERHKKSAKHHCLKGIEWFDRLSAIAAKLMCIQDEDEILMAIDGLQARINLAKKYGQGLRDRAATLEGDLARSRGAANYLSQQAFRNNLKLFGTLDPDEQEKWIKPYRDELNALAQAAPEPEQSNERCPCCGCWIDGEQCWCTPEPEQPAPLEQQEWRSVSKPCIVDYKEEIILERDAHNETKRQLDALAADNAAYREALKWSVDNWEKIIIEKFRFEKLEDTPVDVALKAERPGQTILDERDRLRGEVERLEKTVSLRESDVELWRNEFHSAADKLTRLQGDVDRLKRGDWTPEEVHDICHNLHGKVNAQEFADGCVAEQIKLYGCAPDRDQLTRLQAFVAELGKQDPQTYYVDRLPPWILKARALCGGKDGE